MSPPSRYFTPTLIIAALAVAAFWADRGHADVPLGRYTTTNGTVFDTATKLTWEQPMSAMPLTWSAATAYCTSLELEGSDWRLPSMKELQTIVDRTKVMPAIDPKAFPDTPSEFFWTSSPVASLSTDAWSVDFKAGFSANSAITNLHGVRCVRPSAP